MKVRVNGEERSVDEGTTIADLVRSLGRDPGRPGVAVAVGGQVVARAAWAETLLDDGAVVEVVAAVQGG